VHSLSKQLVSALCKSFCHTSGAAQLQNLQMRTGQQP